jgi:hypothetical protein
VIAHAKAREMLCSSFQGNDDHVAIADVAMANFPTIAIFMSQVDNKQKKKPKNHRKSIFNVNDTSLLKCLPTVNYFREDTHTQLLWLSTTLEEPPIDSSHVMWCKVSWACYVPIVHACKAAHRNRHWHFGL